MTQPNQHQPELTEEAKTKGFREVTETERKQTADLFRKAGVPETEEQATPDTPK